MGNFVWLIMGKRLNLIILCAAVKEAAIQRRHNLYRDSIVLGNSDPNLYLMEENSIDWAGQYGGGDGGGGDRIRRRRQIVSMIQVEGMASMPYGSCLEVPGVEEIPEENEMQTDEDLEEEPVIDNNLHKQPIISIVSKTLEEPASPDDVQQIRQLIRPVLEVVLPSSEDPGPVLTNGMLRLEEGEEIEAITTEEEAMPKDSAIASAIQELEKAVQEEECNLDSDVEFPQASVESSPRHHDDSGFQSPTNDHGEEEDHQPSTAQLKGEAEPVDPELVMVMLEQEDNVSEDGSQAGEAKEDLEYTI